MLDQRETRPPFPLRTVLVIILAGLLSLTVAQAVAHIVGGGLAGDWISLSVGAGVGLASLVVLRDE